MTVHNWWSGAFGVERACDCEKSRRTADCQSGWHLVDSHATLAAAQADAEKCRADYGFAYRVVEMKTGKSVS